MYKCCSKLVCLSEPVKSTNIKTYISLIQNLSIFVNYKSVISYGTGPDSNTLGYCAKVLVITTCKNFIRLCGHAECSIFCEQLGILVEVDLIKLFSSLPLDGRNKLECLYVSNISRLV
jgi:hypothetical protein